MLRCEKAVSSRTYFVIVAAQEHGRQFVLNKKHDSWRSRYLWDTGEWLALYKFQALELLEQIKSGELPVDGPLAAVTSPTIEMWEVVQSLTVKTRKPYDQLDPNQV